jgi:hypothetical protein
MTPESLIAEAYLEAVIRVYAPWRRLPLRASERELAIQRVRQAEAELARLRATEAPESPPEAPADETRYDLPAVRMPRDDDSGTYPRG